MSLYKMAFVYQQVDKVWSEVYYRNTDTARGATAGLGDLITNLMAIRPPIVQLKKIRVNNVENNREGLVYSTNFVGTNGFSPDVTNTAAVCNLVSVDGSLRRKLWIRGLCDKDVIRDLLTGFDLPSAYLTKSLNTIFANLNEAEMRIRALFGLGALNVSREKIKSLTAVAGGSQVSVLFQNATSSWITDEAILSQLNPKLFPGLSGKFKIYNYTAAGFNVFYKPTFTGTLTVDKGFARAAQYQSGTISDTLSTFDKFSSRKTGGNSLSGRGRRSSVHIRSL